MIQTGFDNRVKIQQIVENQLPSFILEESPNASEFLKQYYISQEYQGGPVDISDNLDQYLKLDNLTPEVIVDSTILSNDITSSETTIQVSSTKGFPNQYGLLKIDDEIITYTGITATSFTGCIRGFSGITNYHDSLTNELVFSSTDSQSHSANSSIQNLSSLFLKEFYKKLKYTFTPGLEEVTFVEELNVGNFIKNAKNFYESKGTDESIKILFKVIFGENPDIINLENFLIKSSAANYIRREIVIAEAISGNPIEIIGQTLIKTSDSNTNASISYVEPFTVKGKQFYKIELFIGYDELSTVFGNFIITPNTKSLETVSIGSSVVSVDSTIGFSDSGSFISGTNSISYTSKSVNQFFGCSGIDSAINKGDNVRSNDTYFSYENGDITKKVELIIFGVINNIVQKSEVVSVDEGDIVYVKNIGDNVRNNGKNYKEIFSNSWIYNTSTRYQVSGITNPFILFSKIDKSSLKVGDLVEFIDRSTDNTVESSTFTYITNVDSISNTIDLEGIPSLDSNKNYDIRRILNKSSASSESIEFGNSVILSDVLNLYTDESEYAYVATNSLPSEKIDGISISNHRLDIDSSTKKVTISSTANIGGLSEGSYSLFLNDVNVPFVTGDRVVYNSSGDSLIGLDDGESYYVEVQSDPKTFKLFASPSFFGTSNYLTFFIPTSGFGSYTFVLYSQRSSEISSQKLLRKFPLQKNIERGTGEKTIPGSTGMLINGVEINNYKSLDNIYYGPLSSIDVLNQGSGYDVINPPVLEVSSSQGTLAKIEPVISGGIEKVYVDEQDYDINKIVSINIEGGNGSGAVIEPVLAKRIRDVFFDSREFTNGGGVSTSTNQITFLTDHNFINGEEVIYNSLGKDSISIGAFGSNNLENNASYFVQVDNNKTIKLYNSIDDQITQSNPVGFYSGSNGNHKFSTAKSKNKISYIKVLDQGSGYQYRKLPVSISGISTINNLINFKNHGFNTEELVKYESSSVISGLSTSNQYYVLKIDDDNFRLCDAGIGGTNTSNFERKNYVKFLSTGSGYQYFSYPDISVSIDYIPVVGFGTTSQVNERIVTTPSIRGNIVDAYLYEAGTGYGSTILNFEKKPTISIKTGKLAEVNPVIINGQIESVIVNYVGSEYYSVPDLVITDPTGSGLGAELRSVVSNGQIIEVKVINKGIGYSQNTTIKIIPAGNNAILDARVRKLTLNDNETRFTSGEVLLEGKNKTQFKISKYFENLRTSFGEDGSISGIIGWSFDGNPIYGPYGHSDAENLQSPIKSLESGYDLDVSNVIDRPLGFANGFFVEDYVFKNSGDLDEYNGRFEKTAEFPEGTYVYHATLDSLNNPEFPYFIGNEYHSKLPTNNDLDQSFDFNNSNLLRNTFPYKVSDQYADYDFVNETNDVLEQEIEILSVKSGSVDSIEIVNSGNNFKVGDSLNFTTESSESGGLDVNVSSIKGKDITNLEVESLTYLNSIFIWNNATTTKVTILPNHNLKNLDYVTISGFSTNLSSLNGTHQIIVPSYSTGRCLSTTSASGVSTEIYVSPIPDSISIGSSVQIGSEILKILAITRNENILRVNSVGVHTVGTAVTFLPDSFTVTNNNIEKFDSIVDDKVFFNPKESVGVGTISGISSSVTFDYGDVSITRDIPTKSFYLENHPFITNQKVTFIANGSSIAISTDGGVTTNISSTDLYVVKRSPSLIGLKTSINSPELFFHTNGSDNDEYLLESNFTQIFGDVEKNEVTVSVSTSHELQNGDTITLDIQPNLSVGIGTSTKVRVVYKPQIDNIVINPIGFNSTGINTITNEISIINHQLKTGDKVLYEDGDSEEYFVYKIDKDTINLCTTYSDSQNNPPTIVSFASSGSSNQTLSLINPQLLPTKNNNLVFDVSDSSLFGYQFKIFYDNHFNNEFVSAGSTTEFLVSGVGIVGVTSTASITLNYNSEIPEELFYTLEKEGTILKSDSDVQNYSSIKYTNSIYNNSYSISGIGSTTFKVNVNKKPEKLSYIPTECDTLEYFTSSSSATGPVKSLNIVSGGFGYKKLPILSSTSSENGLNLSVSVSSNSIGDLNQIRVINDTFTYSSDKTLSPQSSISPSIVLKDGNTINSISVKSGGDGYTSNPNLVIVNSETREIIDSGIYDIEITGASVSSVNIITQPTGLPDNGVELFTKDNTNGISIISVESSSTGIFTCVITTPTINGITSFTTQPFNIGDEVFIEGITKFGTNGSGFNSSDYGYKFFKVSNYIKNVGINDIVVVDATELTTNTGIAVTIQNSVPNIINKNDYPIFEVLTSISKFFIGEQIITNGIERDLFVTDTNGNNLKVRGSYQLSSGEIIKGKESGVTATISQVTENSAVFEINYSNTKDIGWNDDIGKLNEDYQVIENNDYYQNLSYSIKSPITYKDQQSYVESLVHTSGLKNFADTGITSVTKNVGITSFINETTTVIDIISDNLRVDAIYNFDNVVDIDVNSPSKFIKLKTKRLTNFTEIKDSVDVLAVDDISNIFSNSESESTEFLNITKLVDSNTYDNYLIRISDVDNNEIQVSEITLLNNGNNSYIIENESLSNSNSQYGVFELVENDLEEVFLRFTPNDPFNIDYNLKSIKQDYNSNTIGIGTESIGFINLVGSVDIESTGIGSTSIIEVDSNNFESLFVTSQITDNVTNEINFVKLYISHDGSNTFLSEYYAETSNLSSQNGSQIGTFYSDLSGGILSLYHTNDSSNQITIRSNIVGFGSTSTGIGTYRFLADDQTQGTERSITYTSNYESTVSAASTTILTLDSTLFNASKLFVEVSIGSTKALHQLMAIYDGTDVYTQQSPFLSISDIDILDTAAGIGTFGGEFNGSDAVINFYPDSEWTGTINLSVLSKNFYIDVDSVNNPNDLVYGKVTESVNELFYNSINGDRVNRSQFTLSSNGVPIFTKTFNPNNSSILNPSTGIFTIQNHFFRTGEELIYTPNSTFVGIGTSAMVTPSGELPSTVYAIKLTDNSFQVATTKSDANSGIGATFTSLGEGNAHRFTMSEQNSKSIISIDNIVQHPIASTKITHTLSGNGGQIGVGNSIFSLSGISTINPKDILKIDNEYMGVINVGLGTTNVGPITNNGTENLVQVIRGYVGTSASAHIDSTTVRVYKGSFNIVEGEIYFTEAPRGNPQIEKNDNNIDFDTSEFSGRVFLKSNYDGNKIYDDISDEFTGIGRTYTLKVGGANTTGIGTLGSSGLIFINNIYQAPSTPNNSNNNFDILENTFAGITSVVFTGVRNPDTLDIFSSESDINVNEVPRGGVIVSLGSTTGLGFAPLVGASVTAVVGAGGSIVSVGLGTTDVLGSGYNGLVSIGISVYEDGHVGDVASITATTGIGGTLSFNVNSGGSGYINPQIFVSDPSYENLTVTGVSRLGVGATTDTGIGLLIDVNVGPTNTTGIGSTYFEVKDFRIARQGYSFQRGDVFKPVGLVTDSSLSSPLSDFELTVLDVYSDNFSAWQFGDLDYIDSISGLQNGSRKVFPLNYNGELLSFEFDNTSSLNLSNFLIIFINGVLQEPNFAYTFGGGTSFAFTTAPLPEDDVKIYFYRGVSSSDTELVTGIKATLEVGDAVQVLKNNQIEGTVTQDQRFIYDLSFSDKFETNLYTGQGVDEEYGKPMVWIKKKIERKINGEFFPKTRDSIESLVFPVANIIKDFSTTDNEIFVDNSELFDYDLDLPATGGFDKFDGLVINGISTDVSGSLELISNFNKVDGFTGVVTGISTSSGNGSNPLAIKFDIYDDGGFVGLQTGYPIYIYNTRIGNGVTSIDDSDSAVVGIGTTFLDNIYYIGSLSISGNVGIITCNVKSDSSIVGLETTGSFTNPVGRYSWGKLSNPIDGLSRSSNPISIGVTGNIVSGLSTYPSIQRRAVGIRTTGALPKIIIPS